MGRVLILALTYWYACPVYGCVVFSEEEDDEYSDDDDVSWKVRRASAKCLTVILGSRVEMLTDFYHMVSPKLIARFKGQ